ncbi:MAG TPA: ArsR family transcriptional regulator [Patescibacteria group bacterium]|nr:ArsR family transcriptional regulator [Patescibacteria group bacterium]
MPDQHIPNELNLIFEALANEHRRDIVYVLGLQPYSVHQLASMRDLSLQAIHKHIRILKTANLVQDKKIGRTHFLTLNKITLHILQDWLAQYHTYWGGNNATLENYTTFLKSSKKNGK